MRIVHVITRLIIGGAQENTLLSCEGQHDLGHDVTLVTGPAIGPEGTLLDRAKSYGYRVEVIDAMRRAIHPANDLETYVQLSERYRALKPDIIHTHSSKAGIIGRWAARDLKAKVIHTIHGLAFTASESPMVNSVYRQLERVTAPLTKKIVCVADAMREQSLEAGIGKPEQYATVYSGMETAAFVNPAAPREQTRARLGLKPQHVVVGTIARLFDLKGHDDLLDISPTLCSEFPELRFLWVGDGSLRTRFEKRIAELQLTDRFILAGLVPPEKVPELTAAMDILVHPSRREGLARALPQGALAGCPVVTYDIDGNREGLIDGTTGMLVRPFNRTLLTMALRDLIARPELRQRMGAAGREFALSRFGAKRMVESLEQVYRDA